MIPRTGLSRPGVRTGRTVLACFAAVALLLSACGVVPEPEGLGSGVDTRGAGAEFEAPPEEKREPEPVPLAEKVEPPPAGGAYLGVFSPPAPFEIDHIERFEQQAGRTLSIVMWYQAWDRDTLHRFDSAACLAIMRQGKVPLITWEPYDPDAGGRTLASLAEQPEYALGRINEGEFDRYIRYWAREIRDLGGPVMLRPMHEMNGTWYPWGGTVNGNRPEEYGEAWRHIHGIFEAEGASNVTWVWGVNHGSVPNTEENSYEAYYPGDEYVDWVAISGFNWGTSSPVSTWRSWSHWYEKPLEYLGTLGKPVCIAEMGAVEEGGDKGEWILDAYARIAEYPEIAAVVYYDALEEGAGHSQDWRVSTSPESIAAFREAVSDEHYLDTAPQALERWVGALTDDHLRELYSLPPEY